MPFHHFRLSWNQKQRWKLKILWNYWKQYICKSCKDLIRPDAKHYLKLHLIKLVPSTFCK
jgi:hypothetical protein